EAVRVSSAEAVISFDAVSKQFPGDEDVVLDKVSVAVQRGELVALIGPSGCGKSTVLNIIAGLARPTAGTVSLTVPRSRVSYVFQHPRLLPWRNVKRNIDFSLEQTKLSRTERGEARQ